MNKTIQSDTLSLKSLIILIGVGAFFGSVFLFVVIRTIFTDEGEWMLIGDLWVINILLIIGIALALTIWYFYKDWVQYRDLEVTLDDQKMVFKSPHANHETFNYNELQSYRLIKTLYGFRRYQKVFLYFKSHKTNMKVRKILLLNNPKTEDLINALKERSQNVLKS